MVDDAELERPANETAGAREAGLPDIVAFEIARHRAVPPAEEPNAAPADGFRELMRALFARKA
jgi:hypothetical protein